MARTRLRAAEIRAMQESLNYFADRFLAGLAPLQVDGKLGPATNHRIRIAKWQLGYQRPLNVEPTLGFRRRLRQPKNPRWASSAAIARGVARRRRQRRSWRNNLQAAARRTGVTTFDGRPVAKWLVPYLQWARENGWKGTLNSGWRDPVYSEGLCLAMCGAPSCPGRCAGRGSNHSGSTPGHGAVDVSDYVKFGELMKTCPIEPRIFCALGPADPVHYSATGR